MRVGALGSLGPDRAGAGRGLGCRTFANPDASGPDRLFIHGRQPLAQNGAARSWGRGHLRNLTKSAPGRTPPQPKLGVSVSRAMRVLVFAITFLSLFLSGVPVQASQAQLPGHKPAQHLRCYYPTQPTY